MSSNIKMRQWMHSPYIGGEHLGRMRLEISNRLFLFRPRRTTALFQEILTTLGNTIASVEEQTRTLLACELHANTVEEVRQAQAAMTAVCRMLSERDYCINGAPKILSAGAWSYISQ